MAANFPARLRLILSWVAAGGRKELRMRTEETTRRKTTRDSFRPRWGSATRWVNKLAEISARTRRKKLR